MGKTTWLVAAVVAILVIASAWAFWPTPMATITAVSRGSYVIAAAEPVGSGIENVYIVDNAHAAGWNINFSGNENVLGTIEASGASINIPYDTPFVIVVAVKGHDDNMAYVQIENLKVELGVTGTFAIGPENSVDANEYVFLEDPGVYIRTNVVWDNAGAGYVLPAGGSITLDPIRLWLWG